ncbi:MAG: TonB-dependent receptor [Gammaproteobacteria bacterium]|uniref:TonB-dependent receptor n=1 Tax=Pseudomaricurvus alcaniphilus TaxID=1166482 RepID=UPI0014089D54|nr:TonB-dependent receptor [Pseudomaricurvus alcaniphilus]MBR9911078.1 TonB-dependent receptor [Gammaproteobacteria bacterium]NHN36418.1 TonB-dependent receptor [Pseudomaricurvus alcaniphilus]
MNTKSTKQGVLCRTVLFGSIVAANFATVNTASAAVLEEIIVTAQKRAESLQETPLSISAMTSSDIENKGVAELTDLFASTPGVSGYEAPSSRGNISISMRGISAGNANSVSVDPANAIYIDGIFLGKSSGNGVDAMDLERIEVLKGPQGTLYGRNSTGGAINFITKKPQEELGAKVKVSAGDYGYRAANARVDVPLSDDLGISLSGYKRERDHLYDNSRAGGDGFENIDRSGGRFSLAWRPTDAVTVDYSYSRDELDENGQGLDVVGFNPMGAGVLAAPGFPNNVSVLSRDRINAVAATKAGLGFLPQVAEVQQLDAWMTDYLAYANDQLSSTSKRPSKFSNDMDQTSSNEVNGHSLSVAWQVDDLGVFGDVEFKSITGVREVENFNQGDIDGMDNSVNGGVIHELPLLTIGGLFFDSISPNVPAANEFAVGQALVNAILARGDAPVFSNFAHIDHQQFSQELQMVGATDSLEYAIGVYYYDDESEFRNNRTASFPLASSATSSHDLTTEASSVFAQATWTPADYSDWSFTGGLRYTHEKKTIDYLWRSSSNPFGFFGGPVADNYVVDELAETQAEVAGVFGKSFEENFYNLSGKFTVQYIINDDMNVFATYSTGYRSGGFNGDFYDSVNDNADAFNEETIESYEIGLKSDLLDGRARFNASVYTYEYTDLQVSTLLPQSNGSVTSAITNAGVAERYGVEASLEVAATDALILTLSYNYIHGDYEEYPDSVGSTLDGGQVLEMSNIAQRGMSPSNQLMAGVDWTILDKGDSSLHLSLNGSWSTETVPITASVGNYDTNGNRLPDTPVVFEQATVDERTIVNGRLAWNLDTDSGNFTLALWGKNMLDDEHRNFGFNYGDALGLNLVQYGEPRTWGVDLIWEM